MSRIKLTDVELSAILSEAEGPGLCWGRRFEGASPRCGCAGDAVYRVGGGCEDAYDRGNRFSEVEPMARAEVVSQATMPSAATAVRYEQIIDSADSALDWMRRAGLVRE